MPALLVLAAAIGAPAGVHARQAVQPQQISIPHTGRRPIIDGAMSAGEWGHGVEIDLPFEVRPAVNRPARVVTTCRMLQDGERLYVGCRSHDPEPSAIRARYTDRDAGSGDDRITLVLDPFDDGQRGFVFGVSAIGVQTDGVTDRAGGTTDDSWNAIWDAAGRITESGFDVEFAIPFRSLRSPAAAAAGHWRFYIEREWPRSEAITFRSTMQDPDDPCALCHAQRFTPGAIIRPAADFEVVPAVTVARTDRRPAPGDPLAAGGIAPDAGLDVRWGASSAAVLNLTANPDFAQIEADAPQLEANTRFALSVPERRPFFLEGAELFRTPLRALFTRTIVDPVAGAKLTGRTQAWSGGALYALDEVTRVLIPGSAGSSMADIEGESHAWAGRAAYAWSERFTAGALITHRRADDYGSTAAGFDAYLRPLRPLEVSVQTLATWTRYPTPTAAGHDQPGGTLHGLALHGDGRWTTRNWSAHGRFERIDPRFRADLGFMPQVDAQRAEASITRRVWGDDIAWLTRLEGSVGYWNVQTREGILKERGIWSQASFHGPLQSMLSVNPFWMTERYAGTEYDRSGLNVSVSVEPNAGIRGEMVGRHATVIDYANLRPARLAELSAAADVRIGRRLSVDISVSRLGIRHEGRLVTGETIARIQPLIGFSTNVFLSLLMQARQVDRSMPTGTASTLQRQKTAELQVLFTYRLDGQTALRFGYADMASDAGHGSARLPFERQSRTFFLKLSYAWRP